jgi:hypothetical protein
LRKIVGRSGQVMKRFLQELHALVLCKLRLQQARLADNVQGDGLPQQHLPDLFRTQATVVLHSIGEQDNRLLSVHRAQLVGRQGIEGVVKSGPKSRD